MTRSLLLIVLILPLTAHASAGSTDVTQVVPREFGERVEQYMDVHRAAAAALGLESCADWSAENRQALADTIRKAREFTTTGTVFSPDVAAFFRTRIAAVVRDERLDITAWAAEEFEGDEEGFLDVPAPEVNAPLPVSDPGSRIAGPGSPLLWRLPPLPAELEYRVIGTSLVLADGRAGLIVDVLHDAVPAAGGPQPPPRPFGPCDVHPDLPACWS